MITQYVIGHGSWTQITTAGQSGSCWLDEDSDGAEGRVDLRIIHVGDGSQASIDPTIGRRVYKPLGNHDLANFSADDQNDVYYAQCMNEGDQATLSVDAV